MNPWVIPEFKNAFFKIHRTCVNLLITWENSPLKRTVPYT